VVRGEQRLLGLASAFLEPGGQDLDCLAGERDGALLAVLAEGEQVADRAEVHVLAAEPGQFGDPQAGLDRSQQQRVVASAGPRPAIGRAAQRVDFVFGEERDECPIETFGGDREHAGDHVGVRGVAQSRESEQRPDRCGAHVSGAGGVVALVLEVVEERADQADVEVGDLELGWLLAVCSVAKQSSSRIVSR
jgi:hypothetical protein